MSILACSILYKTRLPFVVVLNKTDIVDPSIAKGWMSDFELFLEALEDQVGHVTSHAASCDGHVTV